MDTVVTLGRRGEARGRRLVALLFTQVALSPSVVKRCRLNGFKAKKTDRFVPRNRCPSASELAVFWRVCRKRRAHKLETSLDESIQYNGPVLN
ncbi:unnamed protein product [Ectocarpus sp. 8 AP-2014]